MLDAWQTLVFVEIYQGAMRRVCSLRLRKSGKTCVKVANMKNALSILGISKYLYKRQIKSSTVNFAPCPCLNGRQLSALRSMTSENSDAVEIVELHFGHGRHYYYGLH